MKNLNLSLKVAAASLGLFTAMFSLAGCSSVKVSSAGIDPEARSILEKASGTLKAAKSFRFRVQRDVPEAIAEAAGMKRKADIRVAAVRPNKVHAVNGSGGSIRRFYYNGSRITLYDASVDAFATSEAPSSTDAMIAFLDTEWGIRPPMAGLLKSHPFGGGTLNKVSSGSLVGTEPIAGEACNHLSLIGPGVEWDLWISQADHLVRRFDVTVTELKDSPRGSTLISEWELNPSLPDSLFEPPLLKGKEQRDMSEMP